MTIEKNIWADIQDGVTQGLAAAELVNDNKRAVNEVIDVVNPLVDQVDLIQDTVDGLGTASTMTNASGGNTLGTASTKDVATNAQALAGTANVLPDAEQVHAAIRGLAVGTVSQSGGVPTGAIIERGSNANGEFVRYADGTQICWRSHEYTGVVSFPSEGLFIAAVSGLSFPVSFSGAAPVSVVTSTTGHTLWSQCNDQNRTSFDYAIVSATSRAAPITTDTTIEAIGRWY